MIIDQFNYIWQLNIPKESLLAKLINDKNKKSGLCKYDIPENRVFMYGDWFDTSNGEKSTEPVKKHIVKERYHISSNLPLNRNRTEAKVFDMLTEVITKKSVMTKGGLMKYIRKNFTDKTVYSDVGTVANKLVKLHTGRTGIWSVETTARFIRKVN